MADHALDFDDAVFAEVAGAVFVALLATEIDAAGQFAHHHQVHALQQVRLDRRRAQAGDVRLHGAQVGEQAERLADRQQALFRAHLRVRIRPLRPADSAKQDRVGGLRGVQRVGRQRRAGGVDGSTADQLLVEAEVMAVATRDRAQDVDRGSGHFGADAVTGQYDDVSVHGAIPLRESLGRGVY